MSSIGHRRSTLLIGIALVIAALLVTLSIQWVLAYQSIQATQPKPSGTNSTTYNNGQFSIVSVTFSSGTMEFDVFNLQPNYSNLWYIIVYNGTAFYHFARFCPSGISSNCANAPTEGAWTYTLAFYVLTSGTKVIVNSGTFVPTTFNPSAGPGHVTIAFNWKPATSYHVLVSSSQVSSLGTSYLSVTSPS